MTSTQHVGAGNRVGPSDPDCRIRVQTTASCSGWSHLRGPILDESTSALVIICLLPLLKHSVDVLSTTGDRRIAFIVITLAMIAYGLLHITFMVLLRKLTYGAFSGSYSFAWDDQFAGEFRKDLVSAFMIAVVFWLIDRRSDSAKHARVDQQAAPEMPRSEIWLRDGSNSIRVDPAQIILVSSAGNYVEFTLPGRRYLIRGTLIGEEERLRPFGFARVHRTKLVNIGRIVAIEKRPNGDFVAKMDTGDAVSVSRRYKDAVARLSDAG
jgi:hypothetical protein